MKTICKLLIITVISLLMITPFKLSAELKGLIIPPGITKDKIVDYGLCLVGDTLSQIFTLKNTGTEVLRIGGKDPSYYKGEDQNIPGHTTDHREFLTLPEPPQLIDIGAKLDIKISFIPSDTSPSGKKYVLLKLGMYDQRIQEEPDSSQLTVFDVFLLIARKTTHYIDGYEKEWNFDSVYVKPPTKVAFTWLVKNVWSDSLKIDSANFKSLSPNPEFEISGDKLPSQIYPKNIRPWEILYKPQDMGGDSAIYSLMYKPHPIQFPDSIDTAKIKLSGIGVKQELSLNFSDADIYGDTLDFGEVWVDSTKQVIAVLKNTGNMRFGTISQKILNYKGGIDSVFNLIEGVKELPYHLDLNETSDTIRFSFKPNQRGRFISSYVLESYIARRKIQGIPKDGLNQTIYLKGTGIEPEILVGSDTISFGNVVKHEDCPSADTIQYQINNIGNTTLEFQAMIEPPYLVEPNNETISANSQKLINVIFNADSIQLDNYSKTLYIVSRDVKPPKDTLKIIVSASSVLPQQTNLQLPDNLRAKPGRLISVPVIVDKAHIGIARIFSDELTYNTSLLDYNGYERIGTASIGAESVDIHTDTVTSRLVINIEMPPDVYFKQSDTLILLKFNTYLGDNVQTEIAFANPEFGDGRCSKVLTPKISNGRFSLDSICGLNLKAVPHGKNKFRFEDIYPNPANDKIQFEYEMAYSTSVKVNIYDSYGELIESLIGTELPAGSYELIYPTGEMTPGVYYFEMQSGLFRQVRKVVLTK